MERKRIRSERTSEADFPFSDAVWAGDTLYLSGHIGLDPKTGKPPSSRGSPAGSGCVQEHVDTAGMSMSHLVFLQIFCSDVSLFSEFNRVYRTYFEVDEYPARAFLGSGKLLFNARFEIQGIACRK